MPDEKPHVYVPPGEAPPAELVTEVVIPPGKAYGGQGAGGVIGPDETLVFIVDLISVG